MSYAQSPVITDAGQGLLLKVIGGQNLVFTTVKLGDGALTGTVNEKTQLISEKASVNVNTVAVQDEYATIEAIFDNSKIQSGFYWREIGIFAVNPDYPDDRSKDILLAYQNVGDVAEYIPAAGSALIEKIIQIPVVVSSIPTDSISVFLQSNAVQPATKTLETITTFSAPLSAVEFFPIYNKNTDKNQKISFYYLLAAMEPLMLSPFGSINSGSKVLVSQATPTEDGGNTYLPMASDVTLEELNQLKTLNEWQSNISLTLQLVFELLLNFKEIPVSDFCSFDSSNVGTITGKVYRVGMQIFANLKLTDIKATGANSQLFTIKPEWRPQSDYFGSASISCVNVTGANEAGSKSAAIGYINAGNSANGVVTIIGNPQAFSSYADVFIAYPFYTQPDES